MLKRMTAIVSAIAVCVCLLSVSIPAFVQAANENATVTETREDGDAYAVFDKETGVLSFHRGDVPETTPEKSVYTGFETANYQRATEVPWNEIRTEVKEVRFEDEIHPISTAYWFYRFQQMTAITDIEKLDTSQVTDVSMMFQSAYSLEKLDVSSFDTSQVTEMRFMFSYMINLRELNVSGFDTSNVTAFNGMIELTPNLKMLDLSSFDLSQSQELNYMFDESGVEILRLGEKFSFRYQQSGGWYSEHAYLPEETWQQEGTDLTYSPQELTEQFDGATMAGTYILADYTREYIHNYDFEASYGTINTYSRSGGESYYSYCVNDELHLEDAYLNRHPVTTNEELDVYLDLRTEEARMVKSEDPYGALVKVLYYGFPNNGALSEDGNSLQEYFGVSDMRASQRTQYAVHYYSDGTEVNLDESVYGEEAIAYYQALIGMNAEWNVQAMEVPENVRCELYVFSNDEWDENGVPSSQNTVALQKETLEPPVDPTPEPEPTPDPTPDPEPTPDPDPTPEPQPQPEETVETAADTNAMVYVGLAGASAFILTGVLLVKRKSQKEQ